MSYDKTTPVLEWKPGPFPQNAPNGEYFVVSKTKDGETCFDVGYLDNNFFDTGGPFIEFEDIIWHVFLGT